MMNTYTIEKLSAEQGRAVRKALVVLLQDAVSNGASVGFVDPLGDAEAGKYWDDVFGDVGQGTRVLLVLKEAGQVVGSVQLGLCMRANGMHRAEVQKLFVLTSARRKGYGRLLMDAVEAEARKAGRSLLYLDTQSHQPAEAMYRVLGWLFAGEIPDFAASPDGRLHGTMIFYKKLELAPE
jgi:acetyltransferase